MPLLPDELRQTPPYRARVMTPADLKAVAQIDRDAFELYRRQQRRLARSLRLRTPENLNAAVRRPYPGVVVESPPGRVVGYCFAHVWGALGWLGTLGVTPASQGLGLGRAVTAAGLELLAILVLGLGLLRGAFAAAPLVDAPLRAKTSAGQPGR